MGPRHVEHLLIGGGLACATAAATLRERGADGSIILVGREPEAPYHRPPASKGYLQGKETHEQALVHPSEWWKENEIELLTRTSVTAIDGDARTATLSNGETLSFATALIATGANVRRLQVDGSGLEGIHYLRTLANADSIRSDVEGAERAVLVGGSYIGCEVAASLTELGLHCTIVMQEEHTLERGFGAQAGSFFQGVLESHGIEVVGGDEVERFEGDERVARVVTRGGRTIDAQLVVCGVGAIPDVTLARKAGLVLGELGGVLTGPQLESSLPGLFVAGDICEYESRLHGRVLRVEHWDVAAQQGRTAALNMLGEEVAHDVIPYFFSDLSDWASLEYVGPAQRWDTEIVRGSIEEGEFSIFYLDRGRVAAALSVGRSDDLAHARRWITAGTSIADTAVLADVEAELTAV